VVAPVLGYPLPRKGGEFPELVGVFGVGYHGLRSSFSRRLDWFEVGDKAVRFASPPTLPGVLPAGFPVLFIPLAIAVFGLVAPAPLQPQALQEVRRSAIHAGILYQQPNLENGR
jgi:hypothetical protein